MYPVSLTQIIYRYLCSWPYIIYISSMNYCWTCITHHKFYVILKYDIFFLFFKGFPSSIVTISTSFLPAETLIFLLFTNLNIILIVTNQLSSEELCYYVHAYICLYKWAFFSITIMFHYNVSQISWPLLELNQGHFSKVHEHKQGCWK